MNPDIQPHELADMRRAADKMPFDTQQKFHVLLDAYEDREEVAQMAEEREKEAERVSDAVKTLREVYPSSRSEQWEAPDKVSDYAWAECLADCETPEERTAAKDEELSRARAAEAELRARLEAVEEAIESALEELE